jgi:tRNA-2-methylthio-N6-dimethylallyladenosine synthase
VLELMNRTYTREWYLERIDSIRAILGDDCGISHDMIAGFCTESEEDHQETLSLMDYVKYDFGFMYFYSERPGTPAAKKYADDVPELVKKRRLAEIIEKQRAHGLMRNQATLGKTYRVLIEGFSKKSPEELYGRNDQNKAIVFPKKDFKKGQYVNVLIKDCTSATLIGEAL